MRPGLRRVTVRGFGYRITHLADVPASAIVPASWPSPRHTFEAVRVPVVALCGRRPRSDQWCLIVMLDSVRVRCAGCLAVAARLAEAKQLEGGRT